jgi:hypothetical protein
MLRWFPNSKLLLHASHASIPILNLSQLSSVVDAAKLFIFQIIGKIIRNSKFRCLFEATPYHHNVFTFTLFLPEGRAGVAWEPSKNDVLSVLSENKVSLPSHLEFLFASTLHLSFPTPSSSAS